MSTPDVRVIRPKGLGDNKLTPAQLEAIKDLLRRSPPIRTHPSRAI